MRSDKREVEAGTDDREVGTRNTTEEVSNKTKKMMLPIQKTKARTCFTIFGKNSNPRLWPANIWRWFSQQFKLIVNSMTRNVYDNQKVKVSTSEVSDWFNSRPSV